MTSSRTSHLTPHPQVPLGSPKGYDAKGYYPTSYSVVYNGDRHEISIGLDGLVYSPGPAVASAKAAKLMAKKSGK